MQNNAQRADSQHSAAGDLNDELSSSKTESQVGDSRIRYHWD